jgi:hypothetical protein
MNRINHLFTQPNFLKKSRMIKIIFFLLRWWFAHLEEVYLKGVGKGNLSRGHGSVHFRDLQNSLQIKIQGLKADTSAFQRIRIQYLQKKFGSGPAINTRVKGRDTPAFLYWSDPDPAFPYKILDPGLQ